LVSVRLFPELFLPHPFRLSDHLVSASTPSFALLVGFAHLVLATLWVSVRLSQACFVSYFGSVLQTNPVRVFVTPSFVLLVLTLRVSATTSKV